MTSAALATSPAPVRIRASSLVDYADCNRRWACRHLPAVREAYALRDLPSGIGATVGTSCHDGAAWLLTEKMVSGEIGNATEAEHRALERLTEDTANGTVWDDTTRDRNTAEQQLVRMVRAYRTYVAPHIMPIAVEERIEAELKPGFIVSGQADVCEGDVIDDLKTGARTRANGLQYGTYSLLRRANGGIVNGLREQYVARLRLTKPQPEPTITPYPVAASEQGAWATLNAISAAVATFHDTGDLWAFLPNPASVLCSDKFCPAWGTQACRMHKGATA